MNRVDTHQQRLRDEFSAVEKEIESHNGQIEELNKRLEGLKRAIELFESDHLAITELLRTTAHNGDGFTGGAMATSIASAAPGDAEAPGTPAASQSGSSPGEPR